LDERGVDWKKKWKGNFEQDDDAASVTNLAHGTHEGVRRNAEEKARNAIHNMDV
jgi:hypothetical protein